MSRFLVYTATFVFVLSLTVFIVLFGPAPRFRLAYNQQDKRANHRNTPIGLANRVLTKDVPEIVKRFDNLLTGGRVGKVCGYVFGAGTPLVMVLQCGDTADVDNIPFPDDWRYMHLLPDNVEAYPWSGGVGHPLVRLGT